MPTESDIAASINVLHQQAVEGAKQLQKVILVIAILAAALIGLAYRLTAYLTAGSIKTIERGVFVGFANEQPSATISYAASTVFRLFVIFGIPALIVVYAVIPYCLSFVQRRKSIKTSLPVSSFGAGELALFQVVLRQCLENENVWMDVQITKNGQIEFHPRPWLMTLGIAIIAFFFAAIEIRLFEHHP